MGLRYKGGLDLSRVKEFVGFSVMEKFSTSALKSLVGFHLEGNFLVPDDEGLMTADAAAGTLLDWLY